MNIIKTYSMFIKTIFVLYFLRWQFEYEILYDGWSVLIFRCIYHPLCLIATYWALSRHKLTSGKTFVTYVGFLSVYITSYIFYIPDKIDFFILKTIYLDKKLEEQKKRCGSWNEKNDATIVVYLYDTEYPWRVPLIADLKAVVYGPYNKINEKYGSCPECKLVHMYGNWYYWYYENNEMPG